MWVAAGCTTHIVDLGLGLLPVTSAAVRLIPRGSPIPRRLSALLIPRPDPLQTPLELLLIHRSSQPPSAQGAADPSDLQATKGQGKQAQLTQTAFSGSMKAYEMSSTRASPFDEGLAPLYSSSKVL
jgi:hypothetical protein